MNRIARRMSAASTKLGVCLLMVAAHSLCHATVLFSNFGPGLSYDTTTGNPVGNDFGGFNEVQGETFKTASSAHLNTITIALSDVTFPSPDSLVISLTSDAGDQPGSVLESFVIAAGTLGAFGNNNAPLVLTSLLDPLLSAGTQYWLTVATSMTSSFAWNFNSIGANGDHAVSFDNSASWFVGPNGFFTPGAFQVDGTTLVTSVPEPATWSLLGGFGLVLFLQRRSSRVATRVAGRST